MYRIISAEVLAPQIKKMVIDAPKVDAKKEHSQIII